MASNSLQLSGITKRYPGVLALDRVDFECAPGEIHAVLGENGSGKSTLLGIASGAIAADDGKVTVMGTPLATADPLLARRLGLATVYQDDSLVRELSVAENLLLGTSLSADRKSRAAEWAERLLAPYALGIAPYTLVGQLTPVQRQFLEIVKALANNPKVLLLDEPTASLDVAGVETLSGIVRRVAGAGTAVVYVSHRLPEILSLASRVTILRDGVSRGTYAIDGTLSETDLIALMVGRPIEAEYPAHGEIQSREVVLKVEGLNGRGFRDVTFQLHRGEILGFAGAEGNGQREAMRALGGLDAAGGSIVCRGVAASAGSPADALAAGILSLSADRALESVFPVLSVRENMTVQVLESFATGYMVSSARERGRAQALATELNIVTPTLEQPIGHLSGGNQQKSVLARAFLRRPKVVLIDEPTQGVDANARFDIYRTLRAMVAAQTACIVNSSDAMELAGICDRVLVFSRGRVIRELQRSEISEESIVAAFLRATEAASASPKAAAVAPEVGSVRVWFSRLASGGTEQWWLPLLLLGLLTLAAVAYAATHSEVFLTELNIRHILLATAPLALVTMAQFNVLMVRGFDISVGSLMSLTVVLASFLIGAETQPSFLLVGVVLCLLAGLVVGTVNGVLVRFVGINPVITTIAMLSVLQGIALFLRPSPSGAINSDFMDLLAIQVGGIPFSFFLILAAAIVGDFWLYGTRSGLKMRAVGFRQEAAKRNGVRIEVVHLRAYLFSSLLAVLAGFFLASEVGVGHPVIGAGYTLTSIAAAVLGGAALTGGRGSFVGALFGALFFTTTVNIITLLGLNTGAGMIASGALTLFAVFLYTGWRPLARLLQRRRVRVGLPAAARAT
jgi:ribose transport system ATP-binding protein